MQDEIVKVLNDIEERLGKIEEMLFDEPFSAKCIDEQLRLIEFVSKMQATRQEIVSRNPYIANHFLGSSSSSSPQSLSAKKSYYNDTLDKIEKEHISQFYQALVMIKEKFPNDDRALSLSNRCNKCSEEIKKIRSVIQKF